MAASSVSTTPTRRCSPRRPSGEFGGERRHRLRHRRHLLRRHHHQRPHRRERPLRCPVDGQARRHHDQQPGAGRRPRQRPAPGRRGHESGVGGSMWALNGSNGATIWHTATAGQVIGSVVTADLTGGGYQDVIVPTTAGVQIFDGRTGALVATLGQRPAWRSRTRRSSPTTPTAPSASPSPGTTRATRESSQHYEVAGSNGADGERDRGVADVPPRPAADRGTPVRRHRWSRCPATRPRVARWATT